MAKHKAIGMVPFEADIGYIPRLLLDLLASDLQCLDSEEGLAYAEKLSKTLRMLRERMEETQMAMMAEANEKWQPHPFRVGDEIFLDMRSLTIGLSRSYLDYSVRLDRQRRLSVFRAGTTTHTSGALTLPAYSHAAHTHTPCMGSLSSWYPSRPACSSLCSYSHALHGLVVFSYALHGLVVLVVSVTPGVLLVALVLTRSAWSCRLLRRLAWARCSRSICQTRRALCRLRTHTLCVVLLSSHSPCVGSLFSRYPSRPACSSSRP